MTTTEITVRKGPFLLLFGRYLQTPTICGNGSLWKGMLCYLTIVPPCPMPCPSHVLGTYLTYSALPSRDLLGLSLGTVGAWMLRVAAGVRRCQLDRDRSETCVGTTWQVAYKYLHRNPLTAFRKWQELWWSILSRFGGGLRKM